MKVLSLFDGMSCTQLALKNLGVNVETYYSSEIDKYAIQITQKNFPDTIQLGDIKDIKGEDLPEIDLIVAGSPCQGFSFAGKQLAFDDPRSALFFEFIRLLKEVKPKYFLLENVRMKKEHMEVINQQISEVYPEVGSGTLFGGVEPILINSALLSAQNRQRYYWTNIPNIEQPDDLGIVLRDILEDHAGKEHYAGEQLQKNYKGGNQLNPNYKSQANTIHDVDKKSPTISAGTHGYGNGYIKQKYNKPKKVGMNIEQVKVRKHEVDISNLQQLLRTHKSSCKKTNKQIATEIDTPLTKVEHWFRTDTSFAIPSDDIWFKLKDILGIKTDTFDKQIMEFEYRDGVYETKQRVYSEDGKSPTITATNKEQYIETYDSPKQIGKATNINGYDLLKRVYSENGKSPTLTTMQGGNTQPKVEVKGIVKKKVNLKEYNDEIAINPRNFGGKGYVGTDKKSVALTQPSGNNATLVRVKGGAIRGRAYDDKGKRMDKDGVSVANKTKQMLELRKDEKSNAITTVNKDSLVVTAMVKNQGKEIHKENVDKSHCLMARDYKGFGNQAMTGIKDNPQQLKWRRLSPLECERLQTVPDNYTEGVSNSQRYKMLGNGFTVRVIEHILKNME